MRHVWIFALFLPGLGLVACGDEDGGTGSSSGDTGTTTSTGTGGDGTSPTDGGSETDDGSTGDTSSGTGTTTDTGGTDTTSGTESPTDTGTTTDTGATTGTGATTDTGITTGTGATTGTATGTGTGSGTGTTTGTGTGSTGSLFCVPGTFRCNGDTVEECNATGDAWIPIEDCDPIQGMECNDQLGYCIGACSPTALGLSYIGCDYYPTVTSNAVDSNQFNFAVAVSNTTSEEADITVTSGDTVLDSQSVPPDSLQIFNLPWNTELKGGDGLGGVWPTILVEDGAFRVRSTQPVTVYQYSPLEYEGEEGSCVIPGDPSCSYTNDASLLLPTNAWRTEYAIAARNGANNQLPGFYAVIAKEDGTTIETFPSVTGDGVVAGAGINIFGKGIVTMNEGDVLEVYSTESETVDLSGTRVVSDKPIQVIGGHRCLYIPNDVPYCDHLEESMPPVVTLAKEFYVTAPRIPDVAGMVNARMVRVIAVSGPTTVSYSPAQAGAPTSLGYTGAWFEIAETEADFRITATKRIMVAEYMRGRTATSSLVGDPSMAIAVGVDQFRPNYLFYAHTGYLNNYVNVVAPAGTILELDGAPAVGTFYPIGFTGFSVMRIELDNGGNGVHEISGDNPFGISVYGYGIDTSYWYPGGSNLELLPG